MALTRSRGFVTAPAPANGSDRDRFPYWLRVCPCCGGGGARGLHPSRAGSAACAGCGSIFPEGFLAALFRAVDAMRGGGR